MARVQSFRPTHIRGTPSPARDPLQYRAAVPSESLHLMEGAATVSRGCLIGSQCVSNASYSQPLARCTLTQFTKTGCGFAAGARGARYGPNKRVTIMSSGGTQAQIACPPRGHAGGAPGREGVEEGSGGGRRGQGPNSLCT